MPELPEVESTVQVLKAQLEEKVIEDAFCDAPEILRRGRLSAEGFARQVRGQKIMHVARRGKNVLIALKDRVMVIHMKLTGSLILMSEGKLPNFAHLVLFLSGGEKLVLCDKRKLGKVLLLDQEKVKTHPDLKALGPDALQLQWQEFYRRARKRKGRIKPLLLNQHFIAGIGNLYGDEILWEAGVHPLSQAKVLPKRAWKRIFLAMQKVLHQAISWNGTTFSDYRTPSGGSGSYQFQLNAYRREGKTCSRDGARIQRIKVGSRSFYFCPRHQKFYGKRLNKA